MKKILLLFAICFVSACTSMGNRIENTRADYADAHYEKIVCAGAFDKKLDLLIAGDAYFQMGEYRKSDDAFEKINPVIDTQSKTTIWREAAGLLAGQLANDYKPYFMDGLFVSYYQIWDMLALGRFDDARVAINQAYLRQQNMSVEYKKLIANKMADDDKIAETLSADAKNWRAFRDIMNPALTYLSGLYFLNTAADYSDFETARVYLSRANGMSPNNRFINADLRDATNGVAPKNTAWIFIESGFLPKLEQVEITLPWFSNEWVQAVTFNISEPVYSNAPPRIDGAVQLADVDALFMTEYKEYRINEALRAAVSTAARLAAQMETQEAEDKKPGLAATAVTAYSIMTNTAETRNWMTLPKRVYLMRVQKDNSGLIKLYSNGKILKEINVNPSGNDLIYIRYNGGDINPKIINL